MKTSGEPMLYSFAGNFRSIHINRQIMVKKIFATLFFSVILLAGIAQKLETFTAALQPKVGANSYLSISQKKAVNAAEAKANNRRVEFIIIK